MTHRRPMLMRKTTVPRWALLALALAALVGLGAISYTIGDDFTPEQHVVTVEHPPVPDTGQPPPEPQRPPQPPAEPPHIGGPNHGQPVEPSGYVVEPGDTLTSIACELNLDSWHTLYGLNTDILDDPDLIHPGQVLELP